MLQSSIEEISSNLFLTTEAMTRASNQNVSKQVPFQVLQEEPFIFSFASKTEKHVNFAFLLITHNGMHTQDRVKVCVYACEWMYMC